MTAVNLQVSDARILSAVDQRLRAISDHHATHRPDWAKSSLTYAGNLVPVLTAFLRQGLLNLTSSSQLNNLMAKIESHVSGKVRTFIDDAEAGRDSGLQGDLNQQLCNVVRKHFWSF